MQTAIKKTAKKAITKKTAKKTAKKKPAVGSYEAVLEAIEFAKKSGLSKNYGK